MRKLRLKPPLIDGKFKDPSLIVYTVQNSDITAPESLNYLKDALFLSLS